MNILAKTLVAISAGALLATSALAQSAASLVVPLQNEAAPRLFVEPPLPGPLAGGVAFIPYWVENLRIIGIGGAAARNVSPRVGHLHVTVETLPGGGGLRPEQYHHAGYLARGEHKVLIEVVDPEDRFLTA